MAAKPVGGIAAVRLSLSDRAIDPDLREDRSSYEECLLLADERALPRVRHTLVLEVDASIDADTLHRLATEGCRAEVSTVRGEHFTLGRCERLRDEQPLRLTDTRRLTGAAPLDRPTLILTLQCEDTSPAHPLGEATL